MNDDNTNKSWSAFLRERGARFQGDDIADFGRPDIERRAARDAHVLVDLSHFSLLRASGADTVNFLNGQLTNDLKLLDATHTQLSAWCSPKGRMLVLFRVIPVTDGYLLQLPASLRDDVQKRLRMYILRAKVTLSPADADYVRFGYAGPEAATRVADVTGLNVAETNGCAGNGRLMVLRLPGVHPRFEILCPPTEAPQLWTDLSRDATPAGRSVWAWHDVMAGMPDVLPETSDAFVPQMANLDALNGISFTKGCYTGQEIVARVHYLGRLKQRMYRAHVATEETIESGAPIYTPESTQSTGNVVIAAAAPAGGHDLLAVVHIESANKGELRLHRPDGPPLALAPLPYTLP